MDKLDITLANIELGNAINNLDWDHGNDLLYQMVKENFLHSNKEVVLTKFLFIGRIYAAAVERRKIDDGLSNAQFYTDRLWPAIAKMKLDTEIEALRKGNPESMITIEKALKLHLLLMKQLKQITGVNKRSFVSKYLHFHLPQLYYIYDSRATKAIKKFSIEIRNEELGDVSKFADKTYADYYLRCRYINDRVNRLTKRKFSPRMIDNILLWS